MNRQEYPACYLNLNSLIMSNVVNHSFTPDYGKELDIESLISAPLVAVSKANVVMAQGQTRFFLEYCFNKVGDNYEPIMIRMALTKAIVIPPQPAQAGEPPVAASGPGISPVTRAKDGIPAQPARPESFADQTTYFELPLLTIVPLNSLAVDKLNIDFDLEITATKVKPNGIYNDSTNMITDDKPQLYGKISYDPNSGQESKNNTQKRQLSSRIKVNINAATLPLPTGVLSIIELYTNSINPSANTNTNKS